MNNGKATVVKPLLVCPACKAEIYGNFQTTVSINATAEIINNEVPAKVTLTGVRVMHDCIPRATR